MGQPDPTLAPRRGGAAEVQVRNDRVALIDLAELPCRVSVLDQRDILWPHVCNWREQPQADRGGAIGNHPQPNSRSCGFLVKITSGLPRGLRVGSRLS